MKITVLSFCFKELEFNWKLERRTFDELYIIPCITRTRSLYHTDLYSSMQIPNCPKLSSQTSASLSTVHPVSHPNIMFPTKTPRSAGNSCLRMVVRGTGSSEPGIYHFYTAFSVCRNVGEYRTHARTHARTHTTHTHTHTHTHTPLLFHRQAGPKYNELIRTRSIRTTLIHQLRVTLQPST